MEIKRRILLLGGYGNLDHRTFVDGINYDIARLYVHFQSPFGGSFCKDTEMRVLVRPNVEQVKAALSWMHDAEYGVIYFSGHGNSQDGKDHIYFTDAASMPIHRLLGHCKRQITILDTCRNIVDEASQLDGTRVQVIGRTPRSQFPFAKAAFNQLVMAQATGQVLIQSAGYNQSAIALPNGGIFTSAMMEVINDFCSQGSHTRISTVAAFSRAREIVQAKTFAVQVPEMKTNRNDKEIGLLLGIQCKVLEKYVQVSAPRPMVKPVKDNSLKWFLGSLALITAIGIVAAGSDDE
jgi:Caspase domain